MHHMDYEMQACIEDCLHCYQACFGGAMTHCLEAAGRHVEQKHFTLMMSCARSAGPRHISC